MGEWKLNRQQGGYYIIDAAAKHRFGACGDAHLGAVGVWAGVGHGQVSWGRVLELEVLILRNGRDAIIWATKTQ